MNLNKKIVIVDYGVGNNYSISNAINFLGYKNVVISDTEEIINNSDIIILPGVGAFDEAIKNIKSRNLDNLLKKLVFKDKKPILGICVGMQMLSEGSEENGWYNGLNWVKGVVKKLILPEKFSVPHVGWNDVFITKKTPLFSNISSAPHFYFDHSYYFETEDEFITSYCNYGINITASIQKENIFGVQFHPEKSHISGLKLFRSFFNSVSKC